MTDGEIERALGELDVLVGEWSMQSSFAAAAADGPRARTRFEWLSGRRFLIQRWEVDHLHAPDGIAVIGLDPETGTLRQHYFDSRGVSRVYELGFAGGVWTLERHAAAPDFSQRFTGTLDEDGNRIAGRWERMENGAWKDDFALTYTRLG